MIRSAQPNLRSHGRRVARPRLPKRLTPSAGSRALTHRFAPHLRKCYRRHSRVVMLILPATTTAIHWLWGCSPAEEAPLKVMSGRISAPRTAGERRTVPSVYSPFERRRAARCERYRSSATTARTLTTTISAPNGLTRAGMNNKHPVNQETANTSTGRSSSANQGRSRSLSKPLFAIVHPSSQFRRPNAKVQPHAAPTQLSTAPQPGAACRLQRHVRP
jgi:hypothetical protein